jgi:Ca-activated chloride channel family protein
MDWSNPEILYFLMPTCLAWVGLMLYSDRRRRAAAMRFVNSNMSERLLPLQSSARFWSKLVLQCIGIISALLALAGPRFGDQLEQIIPKGSDLYVLIDVSRSMLAEDVPPSRLERAKADVGALVNRLEGERIGLIAFAGQAVVKCPLTVDYSSFRRSLMELDPNSAPRGGTAIGDAIRKALEVLQANGDRDQAILLITDGDDQQSYPKEAATLAAERQVTIFCVGLGDAVTGARVPQKDKSGVFMEHQGEQVWSKLDGNLLQEIALTTSGAYIPAGTQAYDLAELYGQYLRGKRGDVSGTQMRLRKAEQFQIFLAIACFAWLIDLAVQPYRPSSKLLRQAIVLCFALFACGTTKTSVAEESVSQIRSGLRFYSEQKFDEAHKAFAAASNALKDSASPSRYIAAFDDACALHRQGDLEQAKEKYLFAGLSQDRTLSIASHFNLGMLAADRAKKDAGEKPENVPQDKRSAILESLKEAVASYRHCLDLDASHAPSRKNLEIVRQWIKYYSDRWAALDRQKRRDETNLVQFVEFLVKTQEALMSSIQDQASLASADSIAEWKRLQEELCDEIPYLKEKIETELQAATDSPNSNQSVPLSSSDDEQPWKQAIRTLQAWADKAQTEMTNAARAMEPTKLSGAHEFQERAIDELDRIWQAVIPFHPLLDRELRNQTDIVNALGGSKPSAESHEASVSEQTPDTKADSPDADQSLSVDSIDWVRLSKQQNKVLMHARLLAPKAESELQQLESAPPSPDPTSPASDPPAMPNQSAAPNDPNATSPSPTQGVPSDGPQQVDPEQIKAGYRKAIELAPSAVQAMVEAVDAIKTKQRGKAALHASEAERILKEIKEAQPKQPQNNPPNDQDSSKQDQNNNSQKDDSNPQDSPEKQQPKNEDDQQQKDSTQNDKDKQQNENQNQQQNKQDAEQTGAPKQASISKDRIEEALRKVREREQEKRDRDRQLRARIIGRSPVDKDW